MSAAAGGDHPNGTHVCEVEVDPAMGVVRPQNHVVVDDVGVTPNPMPRAGQIHGGVIQDIGEALLERLVYNEEGRLATSTFQDYALPRADTTPLVGFETLNVPSTTNPLGLKGVRGRDHRHVSCGHECGGGCAPSQLQNPSFRHAGDTGAGLAGRRDHRPA